MALKSVLESAHRGYLPAKAIFHPWHVAHSRKIDVDEETQLDWLYDATVWGSAYAGQSLQFKSPLVYDSARQMFHRRGGYNQYFYDSGTAAAHQVETIHFFACSFWHQYGTPPLKCAFTIHRYLWRRGTSQTLSAGPED